MSIYESTLDRALGTARDSTPASPPEAHPFTPAQTLARVGLTVIVVVGMAALFASQIHATLR